MASAFAHSTGSPAGPCSLSSPHTLPSHSLGSPRLEASPWPAQRFRATAIGLDARIRVVRRQFTLQNKTERLQIELREESTTHEAYQRQSERDQLRLAQVEEAQARLTLALTLTLTLT